MSRTHRRPRFVRDESEVQYINRVLDSHYRCPRRAVRVRKPQEQYDAEVRAAHEEWLAMIAAAKKGTDFNSALHRLTNFRNIRERWVPRWTRVLVEESEQQVIAEARASYARRTRDGHWNETGRNWGFKRQAARTLRRADRAFESMILRGEDHEDVLYPGPHLGKKFIWDWW